MVNSILVCPCGFATASQIGSHCAWTRCVVGFLGQDPISIGLLQEIGDKEQRLRQEEGSLEETELEQKSLEAKRNALNDERKEMWRAENEAENSISKIHGNRQKAEKKVKPLLLTTV